MKYSVFTKKERERNRGKLVLAGGESVGEKRGGEALDCTACCKFKMEDVGETMERQRWFFRAGFFFLTDEQKGLRSEEKSAQPYLTKAERLLGGGSTL